VSWTDSAGNTTPEEPRALEEDAYCTHMSENGLL
jgi:hypothetical protein